MAQYRVLQDIESEDKLIGPLSLRQFIYAVIALISGYLAFVFFRVNPLLMIFPIPLFLFFGLLASPFFGGQQSSEVYLLALIRFYIKPRKRVWDQAGLKELVHITVPKAVDKHLTKEHTQEDVQNRLGALASTLDSRGWVVKNVQENLSAKPLPDYYGPSFGKNTNYSDRLVNPNELPQQVPEQPIIDEPDMFDGSGSKVAQNFDQIIQNNEQTRKQQLLQQMQDGSIAETKNKTSSGNQNWFMDNPNTQGTSKAATPEEKALLEQAHRKEKAQREATARLRTIPSSKDKKKHKPTNKHPKTTAKPKNKTLSSPEKTKRADPANTAYAMRNDLTVGTIAHQREKELNPHNSDDGEVVVSLH